MQLNTFPYKTTPKSWGLPFLISRLRMFGSSSSHIVQIDYLFPTISLLSLDAYWHESCLWQRRILHYELFNLANGACSYPTAPQS